MITNQFRIYLCHFHCSHWQNHLLNFTFREKGPLVLVKTTFSSLFWNKLLIPHGNCNDHVPFYMFHHIHPQNDTLGFFGRKYLSDQHWQKRHIRLHGCIWTSLSVEGHGHSVILVQGHKDCMCDSVNVLKDFISENAGPISITFHVQLQGEGSGGNLIWMAHVTWLRWLPHP